MKKFRKKIAILAPIGNEIPPKKQGGIEWMIYYLVEGLAKKGYPVVLFAPKATSTSAELIEVIPKSLNKYKVLPYFESMRKTRIELSALSMMFQKVLKKKKEIGVISNHTVSGGFFAVLEKLTKIPVLHTLHLPLFRQLAKIFELYNSKLITISNNQRKVFPHLNYQKTIYNGIDLKKFPFSNKKGGYFLFAGKIISTKNPKEAIIATKIAKEKLKIVGRISDPKYFKEEIKPLLNKDIVYLGEVSFSKILNLYKKAKGFLFPIRWEEPFGLVMIEAMACGTPVIAYPQGAVQEVIKDRKTGFVVKNVQEMTRAIKNIGKIDRRKCRERVEKYFSVEKMIDQYEKIVKEIIKKPN